MADKPAYLALDSTPAAQVSTLVVDPPYRISLKMGDIEDLFSDNPNTTVEVNKYLWQASLEVLAFVEVIHHPVAEALLRRGGGADLLAQ